MKAEELTILAVRAVVTAMRDGGREAFFAAFTPSVKLSDDGQPQLNTKMAPKKHDALDTIILAESVRNC